MAKKTWPAIRASVFPTDYSPDLAIADFYRFAWFKQ
jgi:hypothetical protein